MSKINNCFLSTASQAKLTQYSEKQPYTSPTRYINSIKRISTTNSEYTTAMPRAYYGCCWGGSALREGSSRQILSTTDQHEQLAIVADSYLLARRQKTQNALWVLSKTICFPIHLLPLEGTLHAHQTKKLMKGILRESSVNIDQLRKIQFSKMSLAKVHEYTPIRNGLGTIAIPKNTEKTRQHLYSIIGNTQELSAVLNDRNNYIHGSLKANSTEGSTLTEKGWQKIVLLSL